MVNVAQLQARLPETEIDRLRWQAGPMLDPPKTLLGRGGHNLSIDNQARGGIRLIGAQA
jgi:hypothetical protein